ncbi:MAG: hypothetical protein ACTSWQ_07830 [Candidatus Thorarchaeota archaeon]
MAATMSQKPSGQSSMGKKKRKHRRAIPSRPAKVMIASVYAGLAALVRLAERRVTNDPKVVELFHGIEQRWKDARTEYKKLKETGILDFSQILSIEHIMRKNYLGMLWQTTKHYGNTEMKRVYNWRQGTIGPLNSLLNYAGAILRSIAFKYYSFPKPSYYQVREYTDGTVKIMHKSTARKFPPEKDVKVYWVAAYPGNSKTPLFRVRHSTLPEMDFVDMIRAHVIELVRQCFIYNVPRKASQLYIRLFIYRLQPFLDWVYTDGATGRSKFWPEADQVLREIVLEVRTLYGGKLGYTPRLTHQIDTGRSYGSTLLDLVTQAQVGWKRNPTDAMEKTILGLLALVGFWTDKKDKTRLSISPESNHLMDPILKLLKKMGREMNKVTIQKTSTKPYLKDADVKEVYDKMLKMTQREGNDWHRVLFGDMYHPSSLRQAIFAGDNFLDETSDILIAAEVPILSPFGSGKADLVVFVRRIVSGEIIWTPIMVIDVKTKAGIDWSIIGKKPRSKKEDSRIPSFDVWKRKLTSSEWGKIIKSTPSSTELEQLDRYEYGLVSGYSDMMKRDREAPKNLWKAIMIIDPDEDQETLFHLLPGLIKSVIAEMKKGLDKSEPRTLFRPRLKGISRKFQHKSGIILVQSKGPRQLLERTVPLKHVFEEDPFAERDKEKRINDQIYVALYLTVASADSSGESAAWIARNWHLLHHLNDLRKKLEGQRQIIWLDLAGELADPLVRNQRLRLIGDQRPKNVSRRKMDTLQELVDSIDFEDLSETLGTYFFQDPQSGIKELETQVKEVFQKISDERSIIVVDGWSQIRDIIPSHLDSLVRTLENRILEWLPKKNMEIIWLDRPAPLPIASATYQLHRVTPLPHDSPRRQLIDEVIWNLPSSPRNLGWRTPRREDIRIIAKDLPTKSDAYVVPFGVPHLKGWAKRFRADSKKERKVSEEKVIGADTKACGRMFSSSSDYVVIGQDSEEVILNDIYQLVPSLRRTRDKSNHTDVDSEVKAKGATRSSAVPDYEVKPEGLKRAKRSIEGLWSRSVLVQNDMHQRRGRPGTYSTTSEVTRSKIRRPMSGPETISRTSRRPPLVRSTPVEEIDTEHTRHNEIVGLFQTSEFLIRKFDYDNDQKWYSVLEKTIEKCNSYFDNHLTSTKTLELLMKLYETREISMDLWKDLSSERAFIEWKRFPNSDVQKIIREQPDLMTRYGNALFLLVQSVILKGKSKDWRQYATTLWRAISDWQWVFMGFTPRNDIENLARHRFDATALWSNLLWRVKQLSSGPAASRLYESFRFGHIIPIDRDRDWIVFQAKALSSKMMAGLRTDRSRTLAMKGSYDTVQDISTLGDIAEDILDDEYRERIPLVITRFEDNDIIWCENPSSDDEREWNALGIFKYKVSRERRIAPIKEFTFWKIPYKIIRRITPLEGITFPEYIKESVDDTLRLIVDSSKKVTSVKVSVSIDEKKERYIVTLKDGMDGVIESLEFERTDEVIGFLRNPILTGGYYHTEDGVMYSWDVVTDITYCKIETENGEVHISFLSPLVQDSSFLNGKYILPKTAKDVLETELGKDVLIVAIPDMERYRKNWDKCWSVLFLKTDVGNRIRSLAKVFMKIETVARLFECEQIINLDNGVRHTTTIAVSKLDEVRLASEWIKYPRLKGYLSARGY